MLYQLNKFGEFKNREFEASFIKSDTKRSIKLMRIVILFASIAYFGISLFDFFWRKEIDAKILDLFLINRVLILAFGVFLFCFLKGLRHIQSAGNWAGLLIILVYVSHLVFAFYFIPIKLTVETYTLIMLLSCIYLATCKWRISFLFSILCFITFLITTPMLCPNETPSDRISATAHVLWITIMMAAIFYSISLYKRNLYAKVLQLQDIANTDYLTKILNRKSCDNILEITCNEKKPFAFMLFDIDNFKEVNDAYGHSVGDDVLVSIVNHTKKAIRSNDILARWGGEEFVAIMPGLKLNEAVEAAKRMKDQIAMIHHENIDHSITCSFGVTTFNEGDNVKSTTLRADQLLYLAKEYGKNRVVSG